MNHVDLGELAVHVTSPALTVYVALPYERRPLEKVQAAYAQACHEFKKKYPQDAAQVLADLHLLLSQVTLEAPAKTVIFFLNKYVVRAYVVPFELPDTIRCDTRFLLEPIMYTLNRTPHFWVLLLRQQTPYLFEGYHDALIEVVHKHVTQQGERSYVIQDAAGNVCHLDSQQWGPHCRYASEEEFIKKIDGYLEHFIEPHDSLVIAGSKTDLETFATYSAFQKDVIASHHLEGLFSHEALLKALVPTVIKHEAKVVKQGLKEFMQASRAKLTVHGAEHVFKMLRADRVRLVCVEKDLHEAACEDLATASAAKGTDCGSLKPIDIIDEILELCVSKGVRYVVVEKGALADFQGIGAVVTD